MWRSVSSSRRLWMRLPLINFASFQSSQPFDLVPGPAATWKASGPRSPSWRAVQISHRGGRRLGQSDRGRGGCADAHAVSQFGVCPSAWPSTKGFRVGIVCHSDHHRGRPGASTFRAVVGPTCYFMPELTRDALFEALRTRRHYGATGPRILLDLHATFSTCTRRSGGP
jgi:hypothetical protein